MKGPSLGLLAGGVIGGVALLLAVVGAPNVRHAATSPAPVAAAAPSVGADGVTLTSTKVSLPTRRSACRTGRTPT